MILYFTGFMGSGKSTIGKKLSELSGIRFIDLDDEIVKDQGVEITEIFAKVEELGFREIETTALKRISGQKTRLIALGGGALKTPENLEIVNNTGTLIYLEAPLETLYDRIRLQQERPLINRVNQKDNKLEELEALFKQRESGFKKADIIINTEDKSVAQIADEIMNNEEIWKKF